MPSLPTSLIIVCLVVAWLVVLVPMVAKRREEVPENLDDSDSVRVLERGSRGGRRRAVLSRTAMKHRTRVPESMADDAVDEPGAAPEWDEPESPEAEATVEVEDDVTAYDEPADSEDAPMVARATRFDEGHETAEADEDDARDELGARTERAVAEPVGAGTARGRVSRWSAGRDYQRVASAVEPAWEREPRRVAEVDDEARTDPRGEFRAVPEDMEYRSAPVRPGRGGFNPAAADRARAYRFRQRRRVALALLLIAVAGAVAGWLGVGFGYPAAVAGGVLLVLYFAYLRRQVRIEAEVRERRLARLDRARQIRPAYRPSVAEQVYAHRTGELPRPGVADGYQVKSHVRGSVPPVGHGYGVPVDLDDSDPVFDDLEYYRPAVYRRRAG